MLIKAAAENYHPMSKKILKRKLCEKIRAYIKTILLQL